ncbi:MAG: HNH endonuclease signature motif containing protein [Candidatus Acidiferrales bacterium]
MTTDALEITVGDKAGHDFLFTWKRQIWRHEELRKLVEKFRLRGAAEELWACKSHRKIRPGDRAYLLEQGKRRGIFGRGTIAGKRKKGNNRWNALIRFDRSHDDVLRDPDEEGFLVDESFLRSLCVLQKRSPIRAAGMPLGKDAARAIDRKILDFVTIGPGGTTLTDETAQEVARLKKMIEQLIRPDQRRFSEKVRKIYPKGCAVTGCVTPAALEAAHIKTQKGRDGNSPRNGILLRSDIHRLFDRFLITLSEDGTKIETSPELTDRGYTALKTVTVARPVGGPPPSAKNIREHRKRFLERLRRRARNQG